MGILNWIWEGIFLNLLTWGLLSAITLIITVAACYFLQWCQIQINNSHEGREGTPNWILFLVPLVSIVAGGSGLVAVFVILALSFNMLYLLWPFANWGEKDASTNFDVYESIWSSNSGSMSEYIEPLYNSVFTIVVLSILTIACIRLLKASMEEKRLGVSTRYGPVSFGIAFLIMLYPILQMVFWNPNSMAPSDMSSARNCHLMTLIISGIFSIGLFAKAADHFLFMVNGGHLLDEYGSMRIDPDDADLSLEDLAWELYIGLLFSTISYVIVLFIFDPLDGTGISSISVNTLSTTSITVLRIGVPVLVLGLGVLYFNTYIARWLGINDSEA